MIDHENYRYLSKGSVRVYGNSIQIEERFFSLTREEEKELTREEVLNTQKNIRKREAWLDKLFEEHVLKHGQDFDKHPFRPQQKKPKETPEPPKRERGDIIGFSKGSRLRLLRKLNQVNPDNTSQVFHVTLTYPKRYPTDGKTHKTDLDAFIKRCKRKFTDNIEYLWKLEFQKRGAPHYHVILYLPKKYKIAYLRKWLSKNWYEVVQRYWEVKLENHLSAGVGCDQVNNLRLAGAYLSKYLSKNEEDTPENQGRFWGCSRNWGEIVLDNANLTGNQLIHFRRLVKRFLNGNERMQAMVTRPSNIVVFGHWSFFLKALNWVKQVH